MAGTPIYTSINAHLATGGKKVYFKNFNDFLESFKKDDLESLMYVLIQLYKGSLPWQNTRALNQEDYRDLMLQKAAIPPCILCKDMPIEFTNILEYIMSTDSSLDPDYFSIENQLKKAAERNSIKLDMNFDWYDT